MQRLARPSRKGTLLMPGVARDPDVRPLCRFRTVTTDAPSEKPRSARGRVRVRVQRRSTPLPGSSHEGDDAAVNVLADVDAVALAQTLDTTTLTDAQAEAMTSPYLSQNVDDVVAALKSRLWRSVGEMPWHVPRPRPEWAQDLRFYGEWWLTLRDPNAAACQRARAGLGADDADVYAPLLPPSEHTVVAETQLVSDLALRLHGTLYHLTLLHLDELALSPDRVHVLVFDGLLRASTVDDDTATSSTTKFGSGLPRHHRRWSLCSSSGSSCGGDDDLDDNGEAAVRSELQTLSLSICQISSASLLVLLIGLAVAAQRGWQIGALDLSYNALSETSLYCMAQLLPRSGLRRLSVRGNRLAGTNTAALRDFLLEGVDALEELDLSYCELTAVQWCVLIECLPALPRLQVLLLDGMSIPPERMTAFSKAVCHSRLYKISLVGCLPSGAARYVNFIDQACDRHRREHAPEGMRNTFGMTSFFERFFHKSLTRGWLPPHRTGLPQGYRPFTNNDPSLQDKSVT